MKLALSNLALPQTTSDEELASFLELGLTGLEVAPTRIAPWDHLSKDVLSAFKSRLSAIGLEIPSLQAIFYGREGAALLEDRRSFEIMHDQVHRVAEIALTLGASVAVFGAPKQRLRGLLSKDEAFALGTERLAILAETAMDTGGLVLGLEPVPEYYGGDFLPHWKDVLDMVDAVDHPGLRVHLDTGCVLLGGDNIGDATASCSRRLAHFQIAEPDLGGFSNPRADHTSAATSLSAICYDGWTSIEMFQQPKPLEAVRVALNYATALYGHTKPLE